MLNIVESSPVSGAIRFIFSFGNCYSGVKVDVTCYPTSDYAFKFQENAKKWTVFSKRDEFSIFCDTKEEALILAKSIVQKEVEEIKKEISSFLKSVESFSLPE